MREIFLVRAQRMLMEEEGYRTFPYNDATGKTASLVDGNITIGVGRNLEGKPLSEKVIMMMLLEDVHEAESYLTEVFADWEKFSEVRQLALINMMFNLGPTRFFKFKRMIRAVRSGSWRKAAIEVIDSHAYKQLPKRYQLISNMLSGNEWPYG